MKGFILIVCLAATVFAQNSEDSLYAQGLQACLEKELASFESFSSRDLLNVIVAYDFYITRNLPKKLGDISVRYSTDLDLIDAYKKLSRDQKDRGIRFVKIFPISDKDNKLFFAYSNYWFSYELKGRLFSKKEHLLTRSLEGGCNAEIGFDSTEDKFFIKSVKLWGN